MASFNKFNAFVEDQAEKLHDLGSDQLLVCLTAAANAPVATYRRQNELTEIAYTNLSSRVLTRVSSSQSSGTYKLILSDLTLSASGGTVATFRYVVIVNDTSALDLLIGWYDIGHDVTLYDTDALLINLDQTNG